MPRGKWSVQNKIFIVAVDKLSLFLFYMCLCKCVGGSGVWVCGNADVLTSVYLSIISGKLSSFGVDEDVDANVDIDVLSAEGSLPNALKDQTCPPTHLHSHPYTYSAWHTHTPTHCPTSRHLLIQTKIHLPFVQHTHIHTHRWGMWSLFWQLHTWRHLARVLFLLPPTKLCMVGSGVFVLVPVERSYMDFPLTIWICKSWVEC